MKKAFTLAEVLVTLGIIGIVAAMTIPGLITKMDVQKKRTILKKAIAEIAQANRLATLDKDIDFGASMNFSNCNTLSLDSSSSPCAILNTNLKDMEYVYTGNDNTMFRLASGASVALSAYSGGGFQYVIFPTKKDISGKGDYDNSTKCNGGNCDKSEGYAFTVDSEGALIPANDSVYNFVYGAE